MITPQRCVLAAALLVGALAHALPARAQTGLPYSEYRSRPTVTIGGTIRDFVPLDQAGGHPDFGKGAGAGSGRYVHLAMNILDAEGKPVFESRGAKLHDNWRDAAGRSIIPTRTYIDPRPGDTAGGTSPGDGAAITSAASLAQWFRTTPGVNVASPGTVTFTHNSSTQSYIFDGSLDDIRGTGSPDYSYSFEAEIPFIYERGHDWWLSVRTNGDALVFVNDKLVIDNGAGLGPRPALAVEDTVLIDNSFVVGASGGPAVTISSNSAAAGAIEVESGGQVAGDVLVGPAGDPGAGIVTSDPASISGITGNLGNAVPIAVVSVPAAMPVSIGSNDIDASITLTGDLHFNNLSIRNGSIVTVEGTCRVLCDGGFTMEGATEVRLAAGARLALYAHGEVRVRDHAVLNRSGGDPDAVVLACMGTGGVQVDGHADVWGHIVCAGGQVEIDDHATVQGSVSSRSARLTHDGQLTGMGEGFSRAFGGCTVTGEQRIHFDRLAWLEENRTHTLRIFYANRTNQASPLRLETNMQLVRMAALPPADVGD